MSREFGVRGLVLTAGVAAVLALSGCVSASPPAPTVTVKQPTPIASAVATPSTTPSTTPTPSSSSSASAAGCPANSVTVPSDAMTAVIGDVDDDGRADTEFSEESSKGDFYGIRTASGAVVKLPYNLAGPGVHSGWTAGLDASPGTVTVVDDGRTAALYAFLGCKFVTTYGVDGKPFTFGLNGFYTAGTGVACNDRNGGVLLEGVLATKRSNGRYDIKWTQINITPDGRKATVGTSETRWSNLAASDPRVSDSMRSLCGTVPIVHTSGK